jgi:multidrug resistance protein, MATE family
MHASTSQLPTQHEHRPIVEMLLLAGPTVAQMASYTVMQFVDTYFVATLGPGAGAAVGNAGAWSFAGVSFGFGIVVLVNSLASQMFGAKRYHECGRFLWQGIWVALMYSALVMPLALAARPLFAAFGHAPDVVGHESSYFRILVTLCSVKLVGVTLGQFLMAVNRPNAVLVAAFVAMVVNCFADYALIFGKWGFPAWGVAGSAWATNLSVLIETVILAGCVFAPSLRRTYNSLDWRFRRPEFKLLIVKGVPSGVQIVAEVLAWSLFSVWVVGGFGTTAMAAYQYMLRYLITSFMPCLGISNAVTALVGRYVGMNRPDLAKHRAHLGMKLTAVYTIACSIVFYLFRERLIGLFTTDPEVLRQGMVLMTVGCFYCFFDGAYIVYNGALRGAADTAVPGFVSSILCWVIGLFGGWAISRTMPQLGVAGAWSAVTAYGLVVATYMFWRFQRGRWQVVRLEESPEAAKLPDSTVAV